MLCSSEEGADILRALEARTDGYILKRVLPAKLDAAIHTISLGESYLTPNLGVRLLDAMKGQTMPRKLAQRLGTLTPQQRKTLQLVGS
jgi:DNA-binding NarL/FixJ family response regulator